MSIDAILLSGNQPLFRGQAAEANKSRIERVLFLQLLVLIDRIEGDKVQSKISLLGQASANDCDFICRCSWEKPLSRCTRTGGCNYYYSVNCLPNRIHRINYTPCSPAEMHIVLRWWLHEKHAIWKAIIISSSRAPSCVLWPLALSAENRRWDGDYHSHIHTVYVLMLFLLSVDDFDQDCSPSAVST